MQHDEVTLDSDDRLVAARQRGGAMRWAIWAAAMAFVVFPGNLALLPGRVLLAVFGRGGAR